MLFSCFCLVVKSYLTLVTLWTAACQPPLPSQSLLKFMSIELVMLSNHLILCCPLLLLPLILPSIRVSSNEAPYFTVHHDLFNLSPTYTFLGYCQNFVVFFVITIYAAMSISLCIQRSRLWQIYPIR